MAISKKLQAEIDDLKRQVAVNRALRWSDYPSKPDLPPPEPGSGGKETRGWRARFYASTSAPCHQVGKAMSSSVYHGHNWNKTDSQGPMSLFSTRLKALQALRRQAEEWCAKYLADVDAEIALEIEKPTPGPEN